MNNYFNNGVDIKKFQGAVQQKDDITIVVLKVI